MKDLTNHSATLFSTTPLILLELTRRFHIIPYHSILHAPVAPFEAPSVHIRHPSSVIRLPEIDGTLKTTASSPGPHGGNRGQTQWTSAALLRMAMAILGRETEAATPSGEDGVTESCRCFPPVLFFCWQTWAATRNCGSVFVHKVDHVG